MSLAEFKEVYFWEYVHRLLGRVIGLAFALPLLWFWARRAIPAGYGWRLVGLLALGGLQGAIGWWMVASGLIDRPEVSHIRSDERRVGNGCVRSGRSRWSPSHLKIKIRE